MSLFKRSVVSEISSHAEGCVMSTLMIVWLSVLMVRLLGKAAEGEIKDGLSFRYCGLFRILRPYRLF